MSAEATGWVWQNSPFTGERLCVHLAIADIVNAVHGYELWMSTGNLAAMARVGRTTVVATLRELCDRGMLELVRSGKDERKPSVYRFSPLARRGEEHGRPTMPTRSPGDHKTERTQGTEEAAWSLDGHVDAARLPAHAGGTPFVEHCAGCGHITLSCTCGDRGDKGAPPPWLAEGLTYAEWCAREKRRAEGVSV